MFMRIGEWVFHSILAGINGLIWSILFTFSLYMLVEWPAQALYSCLFLFWLIYLSYHLWGVFKRQRNFLIRSQYTLLGFGLFLGLFLAILVPGNSAVINRSRNIAMKQNLNRVHQYLQQQAKSEKDWPLDAKSLKTRFSHPSLQNPYTASSDWIENYATYQKTQADPSQRNRLSGMLLYAPDLNAQKRVQRYRLFATQEFGKLLPEQREGKR